MRPNKKGQIAKFHAPLPVENPEQLYVVIEVIEDENGKEHIGTLFAN